MDIDAKVRNSIRQEPRAKEKGYVPGLRANSQGAQIEDAKCSGASREPTLSDSGIAHRCLRLSIKH